MGKIVEDDSLKKMVAYLFITIAAVILFFKTTYFSRYTKDDLDKSYKNIMVGLIVGFFIVYRFFDVFF